jgi:hypothetical protein
MEKPKDLELKGRSDGAVNMTVSCCEIEGRKTVHVDAFNPAPYGHLGAVDVRELRKFLAAAQDWIAL